MTSSGAVEESGWSPPEKPEIVGVWVEFHAGELQRHVKQAGGRWNSAKRTREIHYDQAVKLGLKKRIVKLEVSDIRHHRASNPRDQMVASIGYKWLFRHHHPPNSI